MTGSVYIDYIKSIDRNTNLYFFKATKVLKPVTQTFFKNPPLDSNTFWRIRNVNRMVIFKDYVDKVWYKSIKEDFI